MKEKMTVHKKLNITNGNALKKEEKENKSKKSANLRSTAETSDVLESECLKPFRSDSILSLFDTHLQSYISELENSCALKFVQFYISSITYLPHSLTSSSPHSYPLN